MIPRHILRLIRPTFNFTITISSPTSNYNIYSAAVTAGWNTITPLIANITVDAAITSTSSGTPAFQAGGTFPNGSTLLVTVNASKTIYGKGGTGGAGGTGLGGGSPGGAGGTAFYTRYAVTIINNGTIGGGKGGNGGQGGYYAPLNILNGKGQVIGCTEGYYQATGTAGSAGTDGTGTAGSAGPVNNYGLCNGQTGFTSGGAGGAAGNCSDGDSYITWSTAGTRNGPRIN